MKLLLFIFILFGTNSYSQDFSKKTAPIVEEGIRLYKSEMASWTGTDIYLAKNKNIDKVGGYFSYEDKGVMKCIFFSKDSHPKVIAEISFGKTIAEKGAKSNFKMRDFTETEVDIYTIRQKAYDLIHNKKHKLFKNYDNMNLNLIPIITGKEKKVYVVTGPQINNIVVYGNDYLLTFNRKNKLRRKKALHKELIKFEYGVDDETKTITHKHQSSSGHFITATDICTTMLYEKFTGWNTHDVISKKYVSIWDCKTNSLAVITRKEFEAIGKDQDRSKNRSYKK